MPGLPKIYPEGDNYTVPQKDRTMLREAFSHRFPRARVMPFKYHIPREDQKTSTPLTWEKILDLGVDLLYAILAKREPRTAYERIPIIFVCHSFGGLILKKVVMPSKTVIWNPKADFLGAANRTGRHAGQIPVDVGSDPWHHFHGLSS